MAWLSYLSKSFFTQDREGCSQGGGRFSKGEGGGVFTKGWGGAMLD